MSTNPVLQPIHADDAADIRALAIRTGLDETSYVDFSKTSFRPVRTSSPALTVAVRSAAPLIAELEDNCPSERPLDPEELRSWPLQGQAMPSTGPILDPTPPRMESPVLLEEEPVRSWTAINRIFEEVQHPGRGSDRIGCYAKLAVFSLAGGVGKTTLVANLAKALTLRKDRVGLGDCCPYGSMHRVLGLSPRFPGTAQIHQPVTGSTGQPLKVIVMPIAEGAATDQERWHKELEDRSDVVLFDLPSGAGARDVLGKASHVLVPLVPDVHSVAAIMLIDELFEQLRSEGAGVPVLWYVLNRYRPDLPLHQELRQRLSDLLQDKLLPIVVREDHSLSDAAAMGLTVFDYCQTSLAASDLMSVAELVGNLRKRSPFVRSGVTS